MVYRSSRRQAERDSEPEAETLQEFSAETRGMDKPSKLRRQVGLWRTVAILLACLSLALVIAVAVLLTRDESGSCGGGICGDTVENPNYVDLSEPSKPGPFHDLTKHEIAKVLDFIANDPNIRAADPQKANLLSSYMYTMDLFPAKKAEVLKYLDNNGPAPARQARVIMFRGDLPKPVVEEYACGPLPEIKSCSLIKSDKRRNPVEFSLRPVSIMEFDAVFENALSQVDKNLGYILKDVYGGSYTDCPEPIQCFKLYPSPMATGLVGSIEKRRLWVWAEYPLEYYVSHPVDFGVLVVLDGSDPSKFGIDKIWFRGNLYNSMAEFASYYNSTSKDKILHIRPKKLSKDLFSTMNLRGDPQPAKPLRPPTLVEPDGKRYTLKDRKVEYLGWSFNFRMSALTGPALYDIRYKGERIVYEMAMNEIAVFYSADNPLQKTTDFLDSGALIGTHSKSLVPGGDCPETATFVNQTFSGQTLREHVEIPRAFCLFENNNGYPLRRHLSFSQSEGAFYNGMLDSVLTLRSAITVVNYDYIVDFIFHQNGVIESRIMSTGMVSLPGCYCSILIMRETALNPLI
ncbi:amine oxidase [Plakobranchus ocellatus]|uniref:Amine oxidase n=1 Tax=Plakobranchus ocellatus TaxID=259542 RepID=A0AAV4DDA2_9GAST|nr:amine oxidase [Plakobranchus ocellatus]